MLKHIRVENVRIASLYTGPGALTQNPYISIILARNWEFTEFGGPFQNANE